jgi:hypothetical protein
MEWTLFSHGSRFNNKSTENYCAAESIELFIEGQAFLRSYHSVPRTTLPPSPVSKLFLFLSLPVCRHVVEEVGGGEGVGEETIHTTARKPCPIERVPVKSGITLYTYKAVFEMILISRLQGKPPSRLSEDKSKVPEWGIKSTLAKG